MHKGTCTRMFFNALLVTVNREGGKEKKGEKNSTILQLQKQTNHPTPLIKINKYCYIHTTGYNV